MDDSEILIEVERKFPRKNFHFIKSDTLIPVEGMPYTYKYRGTPEQLKNQLKFKILDAKITIYE